MLGRVAGRGGWQKRREEREMKREKAMQSMKREEWANRTLEVRTSHLDRLPTVPFQWQMIHSVTLSQQALLIPNLGLFEV